VPAGGGAHVWRTGFSRRAGWVLVGFYLALAACGVISLTREPDAAHGSTIFGVCLLVLVALFTGFSTRAATAAIFTDPAGIRIRNLILTDRLRWEDIDRFELRTAWPYSCVCAVILRDGTVLKAVGIRAVEGSGETASGDAEELVEGLNAELREARAGAAA
jgi:hypothetical protein